METKEVTIQNIKFNLSTKPLVSEPETYPDYPSVPINQITNKIITNLINYLPEFITPYLQELQENTIIPDYTTLISITTIDNPDQDGIHILTFLKNDPEHFDDDDTASITCIECLRDTFAYDPEACFGQAPIITEFNSFFTVSIPYNY